MREGRRSGGYSEGLPCPGVDLAERRIRQSYVLERGGRPGLLLLEVPVSI